MRKHITGIFSGLIAIVLTCGCAVDEDSHDFDNKLFISASSLAKQLRVQTDENVNEMTSEFSVKMAEPEASDVEVNFAPAPELLDRYRLAYYDETAVLLPEANYEISGLNTVIAAGNMSSENISVKFKGLADLDYTVNHVLPVTIRNSGIDVLENARTIYFVITEASLINIVADMKGNRAWPVWDGFEEVRDMETFTMEALIKGSAFTNKTSIHTIMGIEFRFLLRVGDTKIDKNQLQLSVGRYDKEANTWHQESLTDPSLKLDTDKWYHVAVTFDKGMVNIYLDGKLRTSRDFSTLEHLQLTSVNFMVPHSADEDDKNIPRCFWVGYSYEQGRDFNGSMAELRLWNRVLQVEEINAPNHFYKIDLKNTESKRGLVAYWKFNDGNGSKIKDWSGYGNDLHTESSVVWKEVQLP